MIKTIKQIHKMKNPNKALLFDSSLLALYPDIEGNESNFIADYLSHSSDYDAYFLNKYAFRVYDNDALEDAGTEEEYLLNWFDSVTAATVVNLDAWARLYYALSLQYNPLYNVDGTTEITYSAQVNSDVMGARSESDSYGARDKSDIMGARSASDIMGARSETDTIGAKETTNGARSDTSTDSSISYDSATWKDTNKTSDSIGSQIINEGAQSNGHTAATYTDQHTATTYTDRHTEAQVTDGHTAQSYTDMHNIGTKTETTEKKGNIGVTMSQQLLEAEWNFRKKSFFSKIFKELADDIGLYYEI